MAELHELASKKRFKVTFEIVGESGPPHAKVFVTRCSVVLSHDGEETLLASTGQSGNKKLSKAEAAKEMLRLLDERKGNMAAKETFP